MDCVKPVTLHWGGQRECVWLTKAEGNYAALNAALLFLVVDALGAVLNLSVQALVVLLDE